MIAVLVAAGLCLSPLFKTEWQSKNNENLEVARTIKKALKRKEPKLLPDGDYEVLFTRQDGSWSATGLASDKDLIRLSENEDIDRLKTKHCEITARGYAVLVNEPIVELSLFRAHLDNSCLEVFSRLNTLRSLTLRDSKRIDDKLMCSLTGPGSLISLNLKNTKVADGTLEHISKTFPDLKRLNLRACKSISAEGLYHLKDMKNLQELTLNNVRLDELAIKSLTKIRSLKKLHVVECSINDKLLKELTALPLEVLTISENPITELSLKELLKMKKLKTVHLLSTGAISKKAIVEFSARKPNCTILWSAIARPEREDQEYQKIVEQKEDDKIKG